MRAGRHQPGGSAEAIRYHYDVGNAFYHLWLDPTMSYSAALWDTQVPDDTLEGAQLRKLDFYIQQVGAAGARRVLDVGWGWGGLLRRLVRESRVEQAVGLTLSPEQARWIVAWGEPGIEVRVESWWEHRPVEPYEAIMSIEALEHFARPEYSEQKKIAVYQAFFARCHQWLRPGGRMALQMFGYGTGFTRRRGLSPITGSLFPETELPTLGEVVQAVEKLFHIVCVRNDSEDVTRSGRALFPRLLANRAQAAALIGEERVERYLKFLDRMGSWDPEGDMALWRLTLRRSEAPFSQVFARIIAAIGP